MCGQEGGSDLWCGLVRAGNSCLLCLFCGTEPCWGLHGHCHRWRDTGPAGKPVLLVTNAVIDRVLLVNPGAPLLLQPSSSKWPLLRTEGCYLWVQNEIPPPKSMTLDWSPWTDYHSLAQEEVPKQVKFLSYILTWQWAASLQWKAPGKDTQGCASHVSHSHCSTALHQQATETALENEFPTELLPGADRWQIAALLGYILFVP